MPFEQFVEAALYDEDGGFYATTGAAGRRGDFLTSPEVGPLFGAVLASALDGWWAEQGQPDPWFVIEAGAGAGTLARAVLAAGPACAPALRYILVERSAALRSLHAAGLPVEPPSWAFAGIQADDEVVVAPGAGPIVVSLAELPEITVDGVVLANELLDNLAFALAERSEDGWSEVWVTAADAGGYDAFVELLVPARPRVAEVAAALAPAAVVGARVPVQLEAGAWLASALDRVHVGRVVVFDYARSTAELASIDQSEWLRTYAGHERGQRPLSDPGWQDITVDVAIDQLAHVRAPTAVRTQAAFLSEHGIEALVEEGRAVWAGRAAVGDLAALRARSRVREAEALTDPNGLGAFSVIEWDVGA